MDSRRDPDATGAGRDDKGLARLLHLADVGAADAPALVGAHQVWLSNRADRPGAVFVRRKTTPTQGAPNLVLDFAFISAVSESDLDGG